MSLTKKFHIALPFGSGIVILLCCIFTFGISYKANAQNLRDSLKRKLIKFERRIGHEKKDTAYINLKVLLALEYRYFKPDSFYLLNKEALKFSKELGFDKGVVKCMAYLGAYHSDKGESEKAFDYYNKGMVLAKETENYDEQIFISNGLARQYEFIGEYSKVLPLYLDALGLAEKHQSKYLSPLCGNIALLYSEYRRYDLAIQYLERSVAIDQKNGNTVEVATKWSNLADVYKENKQYDVAMFTINRCIPILEEHNVIDWLAFSYQVKGQIHLAQNKLKWALYWFEKSSELYKNEIEDKRSEIFLLGGLSKVHHRLNDDSLALVFANRGLAVANDLKSLENQIDFTEILYQIFKSKGEHAVALEYMEAFQKYSDSFAKDENRISMTLLEAKLDYEREREALIVDGQQALARQRQLIYGGSASFLLLCIITLIIYRNEKVQKRLNSELKKKSQILEQRESELNAINKTRTKLFSIIGHDLRGPIGALQGLLKLFASKDISEKDFLRLLPKLRLDIDHIHSTLNNLLSWGYTQMNGLVTRPKAISLENLVDENINLLAEVASQKSIKLLNQLPENVVVWADIDQLDIVIRNLISNALKFTHENGLVSIEAEEFKSKWQISVRDTGVGMDQETCSKLFDETSTYTTYGTKNEKGTGLGLMLCKEMVEKNRGKIWVESSPKKGSCFYFSIPKASKNYKQAG